MKERNKKELTTKEQMVKGCGKIATIIHGFETIFIVFPLLIMILAGVMMFFAEPAIFYTPSDEIVVEENINETGEELTILEISQGISKIISYALLIVVLDNLRKIFRNTEKNETPFTLDNVKCMRALSITAVIQEIVGWVVGMEMSFIFVITIIGVSYIFKYGYELQVESDETL